MKRTLVNVAISLLEDAKWYLDRLPQSSYTHKLPRLSGASIGTHTRHFIENFQALTEALRQVQTQPDVVLNYDCYSCAGAICEQPGVASRCITALIEEIPMLMHNEIRWLENTSLLVERLVVIPTTLERELLWNIEHTLHHFAMIKIGLAAVAPCLEVPAHFGVAPSFSAGQSNYLQLYRNRPALFEAEWGAGAVV